MEMNENSVELQEEAVPASAEGESVEEVDTIENSEAEGEEAAEAEQPSEEENIPDHVWERARKVAEARYNQRLSRLNDAFASRFSKYGVQSVEQYIDEYDKQQRSSMEAQLKQANLDPQIINAMIEQSSAVRNANEVLARVKAEEGAREIQNQIFKISKIDPSVKSLEDILNMDSFFEFDKRVRSGMSLVDAFKIANYDKLMAQNEKAVKQAAINSAKGKQHLKQTKGSVGSGVSLSEDELEIWRALGFDDKKAKQLHEKYAKE